MQIGIYETKQREQEIISLFNQHPFDDISFVTLQQITDLQLVDLAILNVDLLGNDEIIEKVLMMKNQVSLIFVIDTVRYLPLLLMKEFYQMITYPFHKDYIFQQVNQYYTSLKTTLTIKFGAGKNSKIHIPFDSIYYINSDKRVIEVMGSDRDGQLGMCYSKLDDIEKMLPRQFIRCHKSFIVNKDKIQKVTSKFIYLKDVREPIRISRSMKKNVL